MSHVRAHEEISRDQLRRVCGIAHARGRDDVNDARNRIVVFSLGDVEIYRASSHRASSLH